MPLAPGGERVKGLPFGEGVAEVLGLEWGSVPPSAWDAPLARPVLDLFGRGGKRLRGRLVQAGLVSAGASAHGELADACSAVLECLHGGSLIVDDIEDGSDLRRGEPTLHARYGTPIALNAGNWLYFWPFEILRKAGLAPDRELAVYRLYHEAMLKAHFGQALDLSTRIDEVPRESTASLVLSSLELKSGALTAFALTLGAAASGAEPSTLIALERFGKGFGIALQMFDDLGNLLGKKEPEKRWEDLRLRRPTWVWACLAAEFPAAWHEELKAAVRALPDGKRLERWLQERPELLSRCRERANEHLKKSWVELSDSLGLSASAAEGLSVLRELCDELARAY